MIWFEVRFHSSSFYVCRQQTWNSPKHENIVKSKVKQKTADNQTVTLWMKGLTPLCMSLRSPPDETDGPPGAIAIATMLLSLGKDVTLLTDRRAVEMTGAMVDEAVRTGGFKFSPLCFRCSGVFNRRVTCRCVLILAQVCWKPPSRWSLLRAAGLRQRRTSCVTMATPASPGQLIQPSWWWSCCSGASWARFSPLFLKSFS